MTNSNAPKHILYTNKLTFQALSQRDHKHMFAETETANIKVNDLKFQLNFKGTTLLLACSPKRGTLRKPEYAEAVYSRGSLPLLNWQHTLLLYFILKQHN